MERTIQVVQPMKLAERKLLRVAAYARVSCDKDAMKHSLAAQISYYNEYIQRYSDWVFAGAHGGADADNAYTGRVPYEGSEDGGDPGIGGDPSVLTLPDFIYSTYNSLLEGAGDLLDGFMELDAAQRMQIIRYAAIAAAAGPVLLLLGKMTKGVGVLSTGIGKFATSVGKAGGGFKGFMTVLGSSPAVWLAVAAATITATYAISDYITGAKQAREALKGMQATADEWKRTAAETFYGQSEGLSFFGMGRSNFVRENQNAQEWLNGLIAVWTDGQKETDEIVTEWTDSFKSLTASMPRTSRAPGRTGG